MKSAPNSQVGIVWPITWSRCVPSGFVAARVLFQRSVGAHRVHSVTSVYVGPGGAAGRGGLSHTGNLELRNQAPDTTALTTPPRGSRSSPDVRSSAPGRRESWDKNTWARGVAWSPSSHTPPQISDLSSHRESGKPHCTFRPTLHGSSAAHPLVPQRQGLQQYRGGTAWGL